MVYHQGAHQDLYQGLLKEVRARLCKVKEKINVGSECIWLWIAIEPENSLFIHNHN